MVRALSERHHEVIATANIKQKTPIKLGSATILPIAIENDSLSDFPKDCDAYLSWNEPDLLRFVPASKARITCLQLSNLNHAYTGFKNYVDAFVVFSETHRNQVLKDNPMDPGRIARDPQ